MIATTTAFAGPVANETGPNLVTNGGFENTSASVGPGFGWTVSGAFFSEGFDYLIDTGPADAEGGTHSFADGAIGDFGFISQNIATTAGEHYNIHLWLANLSGFAAGTATEVLWGGMQVYSATDILGFGYREIVVDRAAGCANPWRATSTIPIEAGSVTSLAHPGGNATGVSFVTAELASKRLELLRLLVPKTTVIALMMNPGTVRPEARMRRVREAARTLGLEMPEVRARNESEIELPSRRCGIYGPALCSSTRIHTSMPDVSLLSRSRHAMQYRRYTTHVHSSSPAV